MELKNIFKMAKTDRYTQDGRDQIAKLQETEDVKYKTGDISQKTGLQKQPDGSWAPPKNAGKNVHGAEIDKIYEKHQKRIKELKAKGYTDEQIENDKIYQQTKEDMRNVGKSKPAEKSLAGTPMKKADLNSKDPYEITHSMKPDTASEAKEMDKISAFMQEETGATLRNAILARESFYKNTKNPTPEQQEGLAALMKIQQKLGYGKPAGGPALNGQKKTVSYQEMQKGPLYGPAEQSKPVAKKRPKAIRWSRENMQTMHENAEYITPQQADNFYHQYGLDKTGEHKDRKGWLIKEYKNDDGDIYRAKYNQENKYIGYDFLPKGSAENRDSAPSRTTGDTRLRLSQVTDKVYQIGEISQKTGLQKTANGWVKPKTGKAPGAKTGPGTTVSRAQKEEAIRKDLDLRGEHDLDRFSDEQIEMMCQKSQRTPEQQKADFDNSKLGKAYNEKRKEYDDHQAAYKNRQRMRDAEKEIGIAESLERMYESRGRDSEAAAAREYRNAAENLKALTGQVENLPRNTQPDAELQQKIQEAQKKLDKARVKARPGQSKPAADFTKYKRDTGLNLHGKSAEEGEQYMKENGFELVRNDPDYKVYKNEYGEEYDAFYTQSGVFNGGSHTKAPIPNIQNHKDYQKGLGNKYLGQKKFEDGTITQVYLTPEGKYETSHFTTKGEYNGGSTSSKEFYDKWYGDWDLEDAAPRILTGDTKIRIRK